MSRQNLYDKLSKSVADAISDIRQKVVEEPWFGREVTQDNSPAPAWPEAREVSAPGMEQEREQEVDLDR